MVRTSTAQQNNFRCPRCGDSLKRDNTGRGWVAHATNRDCLFEKGLKDSVPNSGHSERAPHPTLKLTDGVSVFGYSERGIINSLIYEIGFSTKPLAALRAFLSLIRFHDRDVDFTGLLGVEVLIEQSLSDFGDADAILLIRGADWHSVVFLEGKVKPSQMGAWRIGDAWRAFLARKKGKLDSSNLFTQLYHKVRLVEGLRIGGVANVQQGIPLPICSTKTPRKLGNNPVVTRVAELLESYLQNVYYVAILPDSMNNLESFYAGTLGVGLQDDVTNWNTDGWGYVSWKVVEEYCQATGLGNTLRVFDFNRGQIY